jgi:hypothetical protein
VASWCRSALGVKVGTASWCRSALGPCQELCDLLVHNYSWSMSGAVWPAGLCGERVVRTGGRPPAQ